MLNSNNFSFIILSKKGKVFAADNFGIPRPSIPAKGTE